jgi:hypothetical protein
MMADELAHVEIPRADFERALKSVFHGLNKLDAFAEIHFEDGWLHIRSNKVAKKAPACGTWRSKVLVGKSWVRLIARRMPSGDPVHLRIFKGRIYVNRYSEPLSLTKPPQIETLTPEPFAPGLINAAATIFKPLLVRRDDLDALVDEAQARGPALWRKEEKKMISLIARAWEKLAPLGVETVDLRRLTDKAVRNAWKVPKKG